MNWGYKILIVYIAFVIGILFLVFKSTNEKVDLVTQDYYTQELQYQKKIDEAERNNALSAPVTFQVRNNVLDIYFPKDFHGKKIQGEVLLYCPSDQNKDVRKNFSIQDSVYTLPIPAGNKGLHELQITWKADSITYYFEKKLTI